MIVVVTSIIVPLIIVVIISVVMMSASMSSSMPVEPGFAIPRANYWWIWYSFMIYFHVFCICFSESMCKIVIAFL